ncbi:hypothetical protein [Pontibacter oryzae]|uniref:Uncharacterized protein n=1 Tax=Pontibacter oryzae TaxID=2304593 RepID=A0A399SKI6_9BACT|nr:hypothetical protein [Pontibacter oryzae]RIJ42983.1 hypothetical protein D1627_03870 [Pontibacter oryzae]
MQEINIRLFEGAYTLKPRAEQRLMLLAVAAMVLQVSLLVYLALTEIFKTHLVIIFLLNLLIPAYFIFSLWLDGKPHYRRHLTLSQDGIRYRTRFMRPEHEIEWNEVDTVKVKLYSVSFLLKNDEMHEINLAHIHNDDVLKQVKKEIRQMVQFKGITLH